MQSSVIMQGGIKTIELINHPIVEPWDAKPNNMGTSWACRGESINVKAFNSSIGITRIKPAIGMSPHELN